MFFRLLQFCGAGEGLDAPTAIKAIGERVEDEESNAGAAPSTSAPVLALLRFPRMFLTTAPQRFKVPNAVAGRVARCRVSPLAAA